MTSLVFFCVIFFCSKILKKLGGLCCCQLPKCFCSMKLKVCVTCMNVACGHTGVFRGATPIKTWDTLFMNTYGNPDIKSLCRVNSKSVMCLGLACRRGCLSQKETLRIEVGFFSDLDIFLEGGVVLSQACWWDFQIERAFWTELLNLLLWVWTPDSLFFSSSYWVVSFTWLIKIRITN